MLRKFSALFFDGLIEKSLIIQKLIKALFSIYKNFIDFSIIELFLFIPRIKSAETFVSMHPDISQSVSKKYTLF